MSTMSPYLPDVLQAPNDNSISMLRALKHIKYVIEHPECTDEEFAVALSDCNQMISQIAHGRPLDAI
jgi:hypothetical protein